MNAAVEVKNKKGKFRFNFVDLLVVTLSVIFAVGYIVSIFNAKDQQSELLVTLRLEQSDVLQLQNADLALAKGETVYGIIGGKTYGVLEKEYEGGDETLLLRVDAQKQGSDRMMADVRLFVGQTVNIRCGTLRSYRLTVEDIKEVTEHG